MDTLPKIVVILGPTASGKTTLGIELAKKFNGEIISADSRQVYKKMTIGTAKPEGAWRTVRGERVYIVEGVPHYMVDIVDPGQELSLADFKKQALEHLHATVERGKVPFLVGGTGLYIWAIIDNLSIPPVPPHKKLRRSLEKKKLLELVTWLKKIDPAAAALIDIKNPRRVIRALEVAILTGESFTTQRKQLDPLVEALQIGVKISQEVLDKRILYRIEEEIEDGWVQETKHLLRQKYGWNLPSMSSLGYRQIGSYLRGECTLPEAVAAIYRETRNYAKRQMTWFRRDKRIIWVEPGERGLIDRTVREFLQKN